MPSLKRWLFCETPGQKPLNSRLCHFKWNLVWSDPIWCLEISRELNTKVTKNLWGWVYGVRPDSWFGGLNKNGLHRFIFLNIWSPVGGTVQEGMEGVTLLDEVCHWGGFYSPFPCPSLLAFSALWLWIKLEVLSYACLPAAMQTVTGCHLLKLTPLNLFFFNLLWSWLPFTTIKKK